jgi:protein-L-isoaspartate O-methyltransferase
LITLARHPFARVDGVEIAPRLASIAERNIRILGISNAKVFCCDASEFRDLDSHNYVYVAGAFTDIVWQPVLDNMAVSLRRRPRKLTLIYTNPGDGALLDL